MDRPAHQVNLFLLLRFFPDPTIDLIFAIKGHVIQVQLFQTWTMFYFFLRYDILFDPSAPPLVHDVHGSLMISHIPNALWRLRYATHPLPPLHSTYKLILSTAFSSCSSASSPWRRLRDRRRPKLEPEQWTRSRIRQLSIISFWFDRHNQILLVWSRIFFVYLIIRLRWLICIGGGGLWN